MRKIVVSILRFQRRFQSNSSKKKKKMFPKLTAWPAERSNLLQGLISNYLMLAIWIYLQYMSTFTYIQGNEGTAKNYGTCSLFQTGMPILICAHDYPSLFFFFLSVSFCLSLWYVTMMTDHHNQPPTIFDKPDLEKFQEKGRRKIKSQQFIRTKNYEYRVSIVSRYCDKHVQKKRARLTENWFAKTGLSSHILGNNCQRWNSPL